jgi:hypothetical protein
MVLQHFNPILMHGPRPITVYLFTLVVLLFLSSISNIQNVVDVASEMDSRRIITTTLASEDSADARGIAYVMYSHITNHDISPFTNYIFPSMDTWLPNDNLFVVLGEQWRDNYFTDVCQESNDGMYTKYCNRIIPVFVECPERYYGESPCCKNEKGMLFFLDHPEIFEQYNWFMYMDADIYVRRNYIEKLVSDLVPTQDVIVAAGRYGGTNSQLGQPSFASSNSPYRCSSELKFMYPWGMPVIYSRQALLSLQNGFRLRGLTKQCKEFDVTHDVGNSIFHWMYQIPNVRMPWPTGTSFGSTITSMRSTSFGAHRVGSKNYLNFSQIHQYFETRGTPVEDVTFAHEWQTEFGFNDTETYKKFGDPRTWTKHWHTMGVEGCRRNGTGSEGEPYGVFPQPWVKVKNGNWTI